MPPSGAPSEIAERSEPAAPVRFILTVYSSTTSAGFSLLTAPSCALAIDFGCLIQRSMLYLAASALKSEPSWNLMPFRSLKTAALSDSSQDSASPGVGPQRPSLPFRQRTRQS